MPSEDPLAQLPHQYKEWDELGRELPKLLVFGKQREAIKAMSFLPTHELNTEPQLERAMLILSFLGHAYVWGREEVADVIPEALAIPWCEIADKLKRPPILSYASYALHNWQRLDAKQEIEIGNIALLQNFLGGIDEEWFVLIHVDIERKAAAAIQSLPLVQQAAIREEGEEVVALLGVIEQSLSSMLETLKRMPERCDPYIYYRRVRPYIHGWRDNPALPTGVIYEGVKTFDEKPQFFRGETGAQSSIIPCFDAVLGIAHEKDVLRTYLMEMREYMPEIHRKFLEALEAAPSIREFILKNHAKNASLKVLYNGILELLSEFRKTHLHYAAQYIQKQSQTSEANPTEVGTGGTPFMIYLRKHKDETLKFLI